MTQVRRLGRIEVRTTPSGQVGSFRLAGRVLYLTRDRERVRRQLEGGRLPSPPVDAELVEHVSTDAIIKANPDCYYYDDRLGTLVLRSLGGGGTVGPGEIRGGGFGLLFAGAGWGEGSSREVAALALLTAGIGAVYAPSMAPIHRQNLVNNGMFPIRSREVADRLASGAEVPVEDVARDLDPLSRRVMLRGGLFPFLEARAKGEERDEPIATAARPMTIAEKILARHMKTANGSVRPGDAGFLAVDAAFSHDYTTAPAAAMVQASLGRPARVRSPGRFHTFPDHLTLASGLPGISEEALEGVRDLRAGQRAFAERTGIRLHAVPGGGSTGICHTVVREEIALPGQVVLGTDSHTCSAGALNCAAYGIGNSEIASIWEQDEVAAKVPESMRIELAGALRPSCTAKDVILELARRGKATGLFTGRVMEFGGPGLACLEFEEQAVLANMAVECNALTAIMEPTEPMIRYVVDRRGLSRGEVDRICVRPDPQAEYIDHVRLDLPAIRALVARPGHPGNGVPLEEVRGIRVDLAYAGSCTAGDLTSISMYDKILRGRKVKIPTYIQYGSARVREEAKRRGIHDRLVTAGVTMIDEPGCGACIDAGPGGPQKGQVAISATNRNMPGRMGQGDAYLANPYVVAASAVRGSICGPEDLEEGS